ncbi:hypothetical protein BDZ94DRAFT_1298447 [Collybia nuda]|uniref:BHLH domain-containing protein n=1 Tax=Collybia nuda TaxID=64659 RepID=A0A9P6CEA5_9AGAR|nr:hypothetical protein BDZ94DRAFT_1298447 [Collybia nuda]
MPEISSIASKTNGSFHKDLPSRHSPPPLAPLHYLQNHRRGSITDPSLHAAPMNTNIKLNTHFRQPSDQPGSASSGPSSAHHDSGPKIYHPGPRPTSSYVFGDATPHVVDNTPQIRNLLRSPSIEQNNSRPPSASPHSQSNSLNAAAKHTVSTKSSEGDHMNVDSDTHASSRRPQEPPHFDYNMRRHSIAVGQEKHPQFHGLQGTKRKMSTDRSAFAPVGEEIDPQLVGPGVPSVMGIDAEAPAPKRRGSAIDTQRIAQLSLSDRRNSVDSRGIQIWHNDKREPTSSMVPSNMRPYSPAFTGAGDSPHGRVPPGINSFAWPANPHPSDQSGSHPTQSGPDSNMSAISRPYDQTQISMMPPMNLPPDRRMSVPDALTSAGPARVLRSRSRPPSRQTPNTDNPQSGPSSSGPDDPVSAPSPTGSGKHSKESSVTPYSRSPELRVSHKLAERKRRKEMKDLFDELRDQLPADRGMKASKWEILSKAIDFVAQLKQGHQDMARELDMMRHELDKARQAGILPFPPGGLPPHGVTYGQGPPPVSGQFPPPPGVMQHPQPPLQPHPSISRPGSSQNMFSPTGQPQENGSTSRTEPPAL